MHDATIEGFKLSPEQKRLWPLLQGNSSFTAQCAIRLHGKLVRTALMESLQAVVNRHEILRTGFHSLAGMDVPIQVVYERAAVDCPVDERTRGRSNGGGLELEELFREHREAAFDFGEAPSPRFSLRVLAPEDHLLIVSLPALCADAGTLGNLLNEVSETYAAQLGEERTFEEAVQFVQFSEWQNELLEERTEGADAFWRQQSIESFPPLSLAGGEGSGVSAPFSVSSIRTKVEGARLGEIESALERCQVSPASFLLACWQILLWRHTDETRFSIGGLFEGRIFDELEPAMGNFSRYLPVPCRLEPGLRFSALAQKQSAFLLEAAEWQLYPLPCKSDFAALFDFCEWPATRESAAVHFSIEGQYLCTDRFKVKLQATLTENDLALEILHDPGFLSRSDGERWLEEIETLVLSAAAAPQSVIGELEFLSARQRHELLVEWNRTAAPFPENRCLHELFEDVASGQPEAVAAICGEEVVSFGEMNRRANRLGRDLRARGVGPESLVGLCLGRSLHQVVAVLAAWKSGAAYVVLEPWQPPLRLRSLVEDLGHPVILADGSGAEVLSKAGASALRLDSQWASVCRQSGENLNLDVSPQNLAYAIFTSGSTGRPKAVMVQHRSVVNLAVALDRAVYGESGSSWRVGVNASLSFDASVKQLVRLLRGCSVEVIPEDVRPDGAELLRFLAARRVDALDVTPSQLRLLLEAGYGDDRCAGPPLLLVGGEALSAKLWARLQSLESKRLFNVYGPTECTVDVTVCPIDEVSPSPRLGRPLGNVSTYVLGRHQELVPVGAAGELSVAGAGLARGYLGRAGLTAERFVADPYSGVPGSRIYRTGDRVRYSAQGELEYLDRLDSQVKLRGTRIELGEIESALAEHPSVGAAVAMVRDAGSGEPRLVAYVVPQTPGLLSCDTHRFRLPNGLCVVHQNRNETEYLYDEIFAKSSYVRRGIRLRPGACVFDVGANIGMFSLFVNNRVPNARIYAFEPLAPLYESLQENARQCVCDVELFPIGLSEAEGTAQFAYYPRYTMMSGLEAYADPAGEVEVVKRFLHNEERQGVAGSGELLEQAEELLAGRFEAQSQEVRLRRLSDVIREQGVDRIDLLKIDVQRAELDVLRGLEPADFSKIDQLVMEVHDAAGSASEGRLEEIESLLRGHGYEVVVEQDELLEGTDRYTLYAIRERSVEAEEPPEPSSEASPNAAAASAELSVEELRAHLRERLPETMLPSAIAVVSEFPLTRNGKVDRSRLPAPEELISPPEESSAPRTPFEEVLAQIWGEVLSLDRVGRDQNFFEYGGHSLLATQLISRVREALRLELPLRALFEAPTVELLAQRIEAESRQSPRLPAPPLEPVPHDGQRPLSFAQQRLWFLDQLEPGSPFYTNSIGIRLSGFLDVWVLQQVVSEVVRRHEILRTAFPTRMGEPVQEIAPPSPFLMPVVDVRGLPEPVREAQLRRLASQEVRRPFDLARGPLVRILLIRLGTDESGILFSTHHIISDGWSVTLMVREVAALYEAFLKAQGSPLPDLPIQYADFAHWQREYLQGEAMEELLAYWRRQLGHGESVLALPTDRPRPAILTYRGARRSFSVPPRTVESLHGLKRGRGVTLFMVLVSALMTLLSRYSGQRVIHLGTPVAGRNRVELENLIGCFVNTLVLRGVLAGHPTFGELLDQVREVVFEAHTHQELPFEKLVEELQPERSLSHTPLFQVLLGLDNLPREELKLPGLTPKFMRAGSGTAKFDLNLLMTEKVEGQEQALSGMLEYNTDLFDAATITRFLGHFQTLLASVARDPDHDLRRISLLAPAERGQMLVEWNDTAAAHAEEGLIHQLFEAQVRQRGDSVAVVFQDRHRTYRQVDDEANRLAHHLVSLGVGPGTWVGVHLHRCSEMVPVVLGILKAGGAYVPMEVHLPAARLARIASSLGMTHLVTQTVRLEDLRSVEAEYAGLEHVICVDGEVAGALASGARLWGSSHLEECPSDSVAARTVREAPAYTIFTSGSTGMPKGVEVRHPPVINLIEWVNATFAVGPSDRLLFVTSLSFDLSVYDIFGLLAAGGSLYVASEPELGDPERLVALLSRQWITFWDSAPAALQQLAPLFTPAGFGSRDLRLVFLSGDWIPVNLPDRVRESYPRAQVIGLGGATEATVWSNYYPIDRVAPGWSSIPYGRPIRNAGYYVLDDGPEPVPIGVSGDLFIGGDCLASGYGYAPGVTAEKFIPAPYGDSPGGRLYRTGDRARFWSDGTIEFLGRLDCQVKVRGYRIELGEIETWLSEHDGIRECVVLAREEAAQGKRLVAYIVPSSPSVPGLQELRAFLRRQLPEYMVPSAFVVLSELPLTANGKLDRRALPSPDAARPDLAESYVPPRTPTEEQLVRIWSEVLGLDKVGVADNFFDLGGDSIRSVQIIARANERSLGLHPRDIFEHQTVAKLAAVADAARGQSVDQDPVTRPTPLTPSQRWFLERIGPSFTRSRQALLLEADGRLEEQPMRRALEHLVERHDALRLRFSQLRSDETRFPVEGTGAGTLLRVDLSDIAAAEQGGVLEAAVAAQPGPDPDQGHLLTAVLFHLGPGRADRVLLNVHRLVVDAVSWRILVEDLEDLYRQLSLGQEPRLPLQTTSFREWALRLEKHAETPAVLSEAEYWRRELGKPAATLPVDPMALRDVAGDPAREDWAESEGTTVVLTAQDTTDLLEEATSVFRAQPDELLLTALLKTLGAHARGGSSLLIDLVSQERAPTFEDLNLSRTVGWLTPVYPVQLELPAPSLESAVAVNAVKERLRRVPDGGSGYGLLRYLDHESLAELARPEILFSYTKPPDRAPAETSLFSVSRAWKPSVGEHSTGYRLAVDALVVEGELRIRLTGKAKAHLFLRQVAEGLQQALAWLIRGSRTLSQPAYCPSDFPLMNLSPEQLDQIVARIGEGSKP